jgi:phosphoribosylglycinamide formyltransferase-1
MRLAVLASWRGTNAKAILDHVRLGVLRGVEPALLIYSDAEAPVRKIAETYGVDALFIPHRGVPRAAREREILEALRRYGVDLVALAG